MEQMKFIFFFFFLNVCMCAGKSPFCWSILLFYSMYSCVWQLFCASFDYDSIHANLLLALFDTKKVIKKPLANWQDGQKGTLARHETLQTHKLYSFVFFCLAVISDRSRNEPLSNWAF